MGTVPVMRTWTTGEVVDETEFNSQLRDAINFKLSPPRAVVTVLGAPFSVPSGTGSGPITAWDTALSNGDSMWSGTQPSRLTANTPGRYEVSLYVHYPFSSGSSTTNFHVGVAWNSSGAAWNSSNKLDEDTRAGSTVARLGTSCALTLTQFLNIGDYVEAYTSQGTGSTQTIPNNPFSCQFSALWISST